MAFYGSSFLFDGTPGEEYGLRIANIGGFSQSQASFGSERSIQEDRINGRSTGIHYGVTANQALSFPISFTVCKDNRHLDRYEAAAVAMWLTGHNTYKQLSIDQPDMESVIYKCIITKLEAQEVGGWTVGFTATVTCDGPFAYLNWRDTVVSNTGTQSFVYRNMSNVRDYYRPIIEIVSTGSQFSVVNENDGTEFKMSGMTSVERHLRIDCQNQCMTSDVDDNPYAFLSGKFPSFACGDNKLKLTGNFTMTIHNEFPWNIGN